VALSDGIGEVRKILQRCTFDADTTLQGLRTLQNYRRKYDDMAGIFIDAPLHNEFSHGADAFRTLAVGLRQEYT